MVVALVIILVAGFDGIGFCWCCRCCVVVVMEVDVVLVVSGLFVVGVLVVDAVVLTVTFVFQLQQITKQLVC